MFKNIIRIFITIFIMLLIICCSTTVKKLESIRSQMRIEKAVVSMEIKKISGKYIPKNITDVFSPDDTEIIASVKLLDLSGKHSIRWDWIAPDNTLYYTTGNKFISPPNSKYFKEITAFHQLGLRGKKAAAYPGEWKVRIYLDKKNITSSSFKLETSPEMGVLPKDRPKPIRTKTELF